MSLATAKRGSKHELILDIMAHGYTYRKARSIVDIFFKAIADTLHRKEDVEVQGFASWKIVPQGSRAWRFGKVITQRTRKIEFQAEFDIPVVSDDQATATLKQQAQGTFRSYVSVLRSFMLNEMYTENHRQFWVLRWHSRWYASPFAASSQEIQSRFPIERAQEAIDLTRPACLSAGSNRLIEFASWYGRWSALIDVDRTLWAEAERTVSLQF